MMRRGRAGRFFVGSSVLVTVFVSAPRHADALNFTYECAGLYSPCSLGPDLFPATCQNARGFSQTMTQDPFKHQLGGWEENNVWDTDFADSDVDPLGQDYLYTDTDPALSAYGPGKANDLVYFAGHGVCDYGADDPGQILCTSTSQCPTGRGTCLAGACRHGCNQDSDCPTNWRCSTEGSLPNICFHLTEGFAVTCGDGDSYGHFSPMMGKMRFGETPTTGTWAGVGANGSLQWLVLDESCGFEAKFLPDRVAPMFTGIHMIASWAGYGGDENGSNITRGSDVATRLNSNEPFAAAWANYMAFDSLDGQGNQIGVNGAACGVTINLAQNQQESNTILNNEVVGFPFDFPQTSAPTWFTYSAWCDFVPNTSADL